MAEFTHCNQNAKTVAHCYAPSTRPAMRYGVPMKAVRWTGSSLKEVRSFPAPVRREIGRALYAAQMGGTDPAPKPLHGFGGASVMEIVAPFDANTYRAVYTVQFANAVYVLHAFQKKAKRGSATPQADMDLVRRRLADARADHARRQQ